jgi:hypothetical protein
MALDLGDRSLFMFLTFEPRTDHAGHVSDSEIHGVRVARGFSLRDPAITPKVGNARIGSSASAASSGRTRDQ